MKKLILLLVSLVFVFSFSLTFIEVEATTPTYDVTFTASFDNNNIIESVTHSSISFGAEIKITNEFDSIPVEYNFEFWVVNGVVQRFLDLNHEFVVTGDMNLLAVFSKAGEHAVVFMDSNGARLDIQYVISGQDANDPIENGVTPITKSGLQIISGDNRWSGSLTDITESKVIVLQYEVANTAEFSVMVDSFYDIDGTIGSVSGGAVLLTTPNTIEGRFKYNSLVTVEAVTENAEKLVFSHWTLNGETVSRSTTLTFTMLEDTVARAIYTKSKPKSVDPIIGIRDIFLRDGAKSFLVQMDIPDDHELIDYGFLRTYDLNSSADDFASLRSSDPLTDSDDAYRVRARSYLEASNEFLGSFSNNRDFGANGEDIKEFRSVRAYIVTKDTDNNLVYTYSKQLNFGDLPVESIDPIGAEAPTTGTGTSSAPYEIASAENLLWMTNTPEVWNSYFEQTADIDLDGVENWKPIGRVVTEGAIRFTGVYDGGGYTISNLTIDRPTEDNVGLFGHIGVSQSGATTVIKNLCLLNVDVIGNRGTGALIGRITGNQATLVENTCVVGGTVSGTGATGGLVGSSNSFSTQGAADRNPRIQTSFAKVNVEGRGGEDSRTFEKIGGLVGCSQRGTIADSYSLSTVTITGGVADRVGGLAGCNIDNGRVVRSWSAAIIHPNGSTNVGVLLGRSNPAQGNIVALSNNYYNTDINVNMPGVGTSPTSVPSGVSGRTTANMQGVEFPGLDFTNIWETNTNKYPTLININKQLQLDAQPIIESFEGIDQHSYSTEDSVLGYSGIEWEFIEILKSSDNDGDYVQLRVFEGVPSQLKSSFEDGLNYIRINAMATGVGRSMDIFIYYGDDSVRELKAENIGTSMIIIEFKDLGIEGDFTIVFTNPSSLIRIYTIILD